MLATLVSFEAGGWVVVSPEGLFDGSPAAWQQILWRFGGNTFDVAPPEVFFNEFYYPGVLADILKGKRPKAPRDISQLDRRQPEVKLSVASGQPSAKGSISSRTVRVKVEVAEVPADKAHPVGSGARDLRLFRNGSLVKVWRGDVLKGTGGSATLEATLPIVTGENRLTAYAFNRDNIKSPDAELIVTGAESLARKGTAYLLAIGINEYANPDYNLSYAVADAQVFAEELRRQQTNLGTFGQIEIIPLLNEDATKANILAALARLAGEETGALASGVPAVFEKLKPAEPEDAVFVFYAGHGTAAGPRFYLIPHDLGYQGARMQVDEAGLNTILAHSIDDRELEQAFEAIDAGRLLLVIDACNSGQALEAEEKRRGPMNSKGLAQLAYEKGMYILTAAQGYQAALEVAQLGHGLLTYALVEEGLKTPAADTAPKDAQVVVREWLDYATLRVPQLQLDAMQEARSAGRELAFVEGEETIREIEKRSLQRPRVFYRREPEAQPLIVAKPKPKP
ncbi:MAG: caspase domain-containing protein [Terriglobia bacterium]